MIVAKRNVRIVAAACCGAMFFFASASGVWAADTLQRGALLRYVLAVYGLQTEVVPLQRQDGFRWAVSVQGDGIEPFIFSMGRPGLLVAAQNAEAVVGMCGSLTSDIGDDIHAVMCYVNAIINYASTIGECEQDNYACYLMTTVAFVRTIMACSDEPEEQP